MDFFTKIFPQREKNTNNQLNLYVILADSGSQAQCIQQHCMYKQEIKETFTKQKAHKYQQKIPPTILCTFFHSTQAMGKKCPLYEPNTPQTLWTQGPILNLRPHKSMNPWAHKFYEPMSRTNFMSPKPHKFYEPKAPQTLFMHLRLYKSYAPKTLQNLWAQGPINFMNPKPHKWLYNPKAQKHLWAQHPTNIVNPRPHKFYEPKAPWGQYPTNCVNPTKSFAKRNV